MNVETFARMFASWMNSEYSWNEDVGTQLNYESAAEQFETEFVAGTAWLKEEYRDHVGYSHRLVEAFYDL